MSTLSFDQVLQAAEQLTPQEQDALIAHLRARGGASPSERDIALREKIKAEFARRKAAGAFDNLESLKGKFARPGALPPDADEVESYLRSLSSEWEEDLDDLAN
jgi:hypothetical protein